MSSEAYGVSLSRFSRLEDGKDFLRGKGVAEDLQVRRSTAVGTAAVEALADVVAQDQMRLVGKVNRVRIDD